MYLVESKGGAIALIVVAIFTLGSWAAMVLICERRGRQPMHTYLDYACTFYVVAVIVALTLGQIGPSTEEVPNFLTQIHQKNGPSIGFALAGGIFLCIGNMCVQYAIPFLGLSITELIMTCLTVTIGGTLNFLLDRTINNPAILFPGVGCFVIAAVLAAVTHYYNKRDQDRKMGISRSTAAMEKSVENGRAGLPSTTAEAKHTEDSDKESGDSIHTAGGEVPPVPRHLVGSGEYLMAQEERRAVKVAGSGLYVGLCIALLGGISFGLYTPSFNLATNDSWHTLDAGVPHLVVYTAFFYFSTSFLLLALLVNITFLYRPILGLKKSSISEWLCDWENRQYACMAGIFGGVGNTVQFMGGQAGGYAAAEAVNGLSLWSTILAIIFFGEYRRTSSITKGLLVSMISMFVLAVGLLMGSAGTRTKS